MKKGIRRVPAPHDLGALFPYILKRRCDSLVYYNVDIDVEPLLRHIETHHEFTFFQAIVLAIVKTMREKPQMNRFIMGRRLYERDFLDVNFIARREFSEEGSESNVKIRIKPEDDHKAVIAKMTRDIRKVRNGEEKDDDAFIAMLLKLPRFALRAVVAFLTWCDFHMIFPKDIEAIDPLHCSVFLANLGSVGIDAPFHHLFEWGTCSLFVAIGQIGKKPVVREDDTIGVKTMVELKIALDERISDGYYYARSFDYFKSLLEHPEKLLEKGDINASETVV